MSNLEEIQSLATPIAIQIRWSDQDTNGHVNNANIATLFEEARIRARSIWLDDAPDSAAGKLLVRAQTTSFDAEVHYGAQTSILVWIARIGGSSYVVAHLLVQDGKPCAYMEVTIVVVDRETGKPKKHNDEFRSQLEAHSGPAYSARS